MTSPDSPDLAEGLAALGRAARGVVEAFDSYVRSLCSALRPLLQWFDDNREQLEAYHRDLAEHPDLFVEPTPCLCLCAAHRHSGICLGASTAPWYVVVGEQEVAMCLPCARAHQLAARHVQ